MALLTLDKAFETQAEVSFVHSFKLSPECRQSIGPISLKREGLRWMNAVRQADSTQSRI
jgi:hypothetical protein